jgi:stress response protein YsnF
MPDVDIDTALEWRGRTVVDRDGERIGTLDELYLDERDQPAWAAIRTGFLGLQHSLVPLTDMRPAGDDLEVPYDRQRIKDAPAVEASEQVLDEDADRLRRHYGLDGARTDRDDVVATRMAEAESGTDEPREAADRPGPASTEAETDDAMTRSEEELVVGTRRRSRGRARLRKYVVTEHVQKTIPVRREEVRLEFEPADGENAERPEDSDPPAEDPDAPAQPRS